MGITTEAEPTEYATASDKEVVLKKLPGKLKPPTITLKRGLTDGLELRSWHEAVRTGDLSRARRDTFLTAYNAAGKAVAKRWIEKAWPSKLTLGGLKAGSTTINVETVTLVGEYLQRVSLQ